jgi:twitching motility protein PilT
MAFFDVNPLLAKMLDVAPGISDLNLSVGKPPQVEVEGQLRPVPFAGIERLAPYQVELVAMRLLRGKRDLTERLLRTGSVDLSYSLAQKTRFRVNVFSQRGSYSVVLRVIPNRIPTVEELGLPQQLNEITQERTGIVLVTGPTGSGKSTTLAALINKMNREKSIHIITIEDPIEYLYPSLKATINQREVGADTQTFALALRAALRQAPKVILVGEMRDRETIEIALEAAETGHLVMSTLHTIDASKTVERIIGTFSMSEQHAIRNRFAKAFRFIISQRLLPRAGGKGRVAVLEILKSTLRTREYVEKGENEGRTLLDAMRDGGQDGMQYFDAEIEKLIRARTIDLDVGLSHATNPGNLRLELSDFIDEMNAVAAETAPGN